MKVAQIIDSLKSGGAEQLMTLFVREAKHRNLDTTIISLRKEMDPGILRRLQENGAKVCALPASKGMSPVRLVQVVRYLLETKIQLVQTHLTTSNIIGTLASHLAGVKSISTLHSVSIDPRYYSRVRHTLETRVLRHLSDRVVAVGHAVSAANQSRLQRPLDVIPNAITPLNPLSEKRRQQIRSKLLEDPEDRLLVSVGRLSPPKGYSILIQAFFVLQKRYPKVKLVIVGNGILKNDLMSQIETLSLQNSIVLLGHREDVPELLGASDVYVNASLWEGLPLSILEAMSAGLPVVATEVGDLERIVPARAGFLVPPNEPEILANAMQRMLEDPDSAERGAVGRDFVTMHHGPGVWMDQLMRLYDQVLSDNKLRKAI